MPPSAEPAEIKRAYRKLARDHHPDLNPGQDGTRFKEIAAAFEVLSDPVRRRAHDDSRGRKARGALPEAFLDAVYDAVDRAQAYVERMVLPHYAQRWRGAGAEAVASLWQELEALRDTAHLAGTQPGPVARWRARHLVRRLRVGVDLAPSASASLRHRSVAGLWHVVITPWILHERGFSEPAEIDDAVLRILLQHYATILASGRFSPPRDPAGWPGALVQARRTDDAHGLQRGLRWAGILILTGFIATLLYAGYAGW